METLYFDCFSGISGDMVLGAFLDLGVDETYLKQELEKLHLDHYQLYGEKTKKLGITGTYCHVDAREEHVHRHFYEIRQMIWDSELDAKVKETAVAIFERVAKAEGRVHGVPAEHVHFHEVGALDSIIDIVGAAICFHAVAPKRVFVSGINVGSGWVHCAHGVIPVPAPATVEILSEAKIQMYSKWIEQECATPTGVAIVAELAEYTQKIPNIIPKKVAYGFGKKDFPIPNGLRLIYGELQETASAGTGDDAWMIDSTKASDERVNEVNQETDHTLNHVVVLETNIDDGTGELLGYVMEQLFAVGALDVFYTPIYMKKNRPAVKLTVLVKKSDVERMENLILRETPTIGIRKYETERTCMERSMRYVDTVYGTITVKSCVYGDIKKETLEYEEVAQIARKYQKPYLDVVDELMQYVKE